MAKLFYDHLIIIEEVIILLDQKKTDVKEKEKLLAIIDDTLNHRILNIILTHLRKHHHEEFLKKIAHHPYDSGIMLFLKEKTTVDIEKEIMKTANNVKRSVIKEIHNHSAKAT